MTNRHLTPLLMLALFSCDPTLPSPSALGVAPDDTPSSTASLASDMAAEELVPEEEPAAHPEEFPHAPDAFEGVSWSGVGAVQYGAPITLMEEAGMVLSMQPWRFEEVEGVAYRVEIPRQGAMARVLVPEQVDALAEFAADDSGPWAAINGGFYEFSQDIPNTYEAMGVVRSGTYGDHHDYQVRGGSGIFLVREGAPQIIHRRDWETHKDATTTEALQSIDRLISGGEVLVKKRGEEERRAARSAVALSSESLWLVVLVELGSLRPFEDGVRLRQTSYLGLPLWAFAAYLAETTHAEEALNMDGAVSTQLMVRAREQSFKVIGERGTINAIELRPARR